eukprot:EG_transcript_34955
MAQAVRLQNDVNVVLYFFDRIFLREAPEYIIAADADWIAFRTPDHRLLAAELTDAGFRRDSRAAGLLHWSARRGKWDEFRARHRRAVEDRLRSTFLQALEEYRSLFEDWLLSSPDAGTQSRALEALHGAKTSGKVEVDVGPQEEEVVEQLVRMGLVCVPSAHDDSLFGLHT